MATLRVFIASGARDDENDEIRARLRSRKGFSVRGHKMVRGWKGIASSPGFAHHANSLLTRHGLRRAWSADRR